MKLSKIGLGLFACLLGTQTPNAFASGRVFFSPKSYSVIVSAHVYFYGPAATSDIVKAATDEINLYWNGGSHLDNQFIKLQTRLGGGIEKFSLRVTSEIVSEAEATSLMLHNTKLENNFIKLLPGNAANGDRSYMDQLCGNTGTWYLSDDLGKSTTAAHEFGHGLCLDHPSAPDFRGKGQPPIMAPRGTYVDSRYQWNPSAAAGAPGGTLSPYQRRVIQFDVDSLPLSSLNFDSSGFAYLATPHLANAGTRTYE